MRKASQTDAELLLRLWEIYRRERKAFRWFLFDLKARDYAEFCRQYSPTSGQRDNFTAVCGFFELAGSLVKNGLLNQSLFFENFTPVPFWERARPIVEGMREKISKRMYANFENLYLTRKKSEAKKPAR